MVFVLFSINHFITYLDNDRLIMKYFTVKFWRRKRRSSRRMRMRRRRRKRRRIYLKYCSNMSVHHRNTKLKKYKHMKNNYIIISSRNSRNVFKLPFVRTLLYIFKNFNTVRCEATQMFGFNTC